VHPLAPVPGRHPKTLNDSGCSPNRDQTFGLAVIRRGELIVLIENNVVVHTDHGMIWLGGRSDEVRK
jgi:hypothetical protein